MYTRIALLLSLVGVVPLASADEVSYLRDIKPILSDSCYTCHGPDEAAREADFRFDVRESALEHAIEAGNPADSEMLKRITSSDPDELMPPADSQRPRLKPAQVELLKKWIAQGAKYQEHWAYIPPKPVQPPAVKNTATVINPIDNFVIARLEEKGMSLSPVANARTLVRRVSFDLLGLPPTQTDVDRVSGNPESFPTLIEEMLGSPHFGERMAVYWLDTVRYADSVGIHGDQLISMSPYRDYVINAFNENMPYDQFLTEQLAGDLLPEATTDQKVASAFNRLHMITSEGGAQPKEYLAKYAADRVRNTSAALFGTTFGCAECHDHKFDPFSTKEFYQFASFFADLKETGVYGGSNWFPMMPVPDESQSARLAELDKQAAEKEKAFKADEKNEELKKAFEAAKKARDDYKKNIPSVTVSESVKPREMRVLPRGNWLDDTGEVVSPTFPVSITRNPIVPKENEKLTRRDLADWMTARDNPLVARVFVNRLWKLMMGRGIVRSLDDFGSQGTPPTHPELLDWLAIEFIESGWDVKHMLRLIANSNTYRQSSIVTEEGFKADATNSLLSRQNRFRIDAEFIRDNALTISGKLVTKVGGKSVRPYQPVGYYKHLNFPRRTYKHDKGDSLYRRGLYTHWQRTFLHPSLMAFDAPTREECTVDRPRSNTPLQSLVLLNDPTYVEAARVFAERILRGAESTPDRLKFAYRSALQRDPKENELEILSKLVDGHLRHFDSDAETAKAIFANGESGTPEDLKASEVAAWSSVARTILNLHEVITRY